MPKRILVVDDNAELLRATRRMLRGYDVATVDDPRSAVVIVAAGARFDAIVSDFRMPHLDGRALHETLKAIAEEQAARMIFLTASSSDPPVRAWIEEAGLVRLRKPIDPGTFRAAVDRALGR